MMRLGCLLACCCTIFAASALPTREAPTTDGTALVGLTEATISPAAVLQRFVDKGEIAGAVSMVAVSGKVETVCAGLADPTTGRSFDERSLFWIASMTKGFCGAAVMSCVDKGLLSLDDRVEKYIPEIANVKVEEKDAEGKTILRPPATKMTLRMCLAQVAGYPFSTPLAIERGSRNLSMEEHVKGAVDCPLLHDPLTKYRYSNVGINLAGRIVEIVTGKAFEDYLQETFFDPLDMKDITFFPTAAQMSNKVYVARLEEGHHYEDGRADKWAAYLNVPEFRRGQGHAIAAGGLYSTAADVMKFYLMLANDGKAPDGRRILSHAAIVELSRAQYPELDRYTLGMRQFGDWFGHDGALQTQAYANWKENRASLLFVQATGSWSHPFKKDWQSAAISSASGPRLARKIGEAHSILRVDSFYGFDRTVFDFEGYEAWLVEPKEGTSRDGFPWTWTMQWATAFVPRTGVPQLLADGFHHATIITFKDKMDEKGLAVSARFQKYLVEELGLAPKANLIGMSWGGFFATRYAVRYPQNVNRIYLDAPLLCFKDGVGADALQEQKYGTWAASAPSDGKWSLDPRMPVNQAEKLAETQIPVFLVYGGQDDSCPPSRNALPFIRHYQSAGVGSRLKVMFRAYFGHHPHGFDPGERTVSDFFEKEFVPDESQQDILGLQHSESVSAVRVLTIGNSFSDSLLTDFPGVAESIGVNLDFTSLYIAGCSLQRHVDNLKRDGESAFAPYSMIRVVCGKRLPERLINLGDVLREYKYDLISIHQASPDSWRAETYSPAGDELLAAIRKWQPQARILVQETWSYTPWDKRLAQWGISADEMYAAVHQACTAFAMRHGLHVIPMGAGVDRWRHDLPVRYAENSFGGDLCGGRWCKPEEMFVRTNEGGYVPSPKCDVYHLNECGEYFQALLWTADVFGVDVRRSSYVPRAVDPKTAARLRDFVMDFLSLGGLKRGGMKVGD